MKRGEAKLLGSEKVEINGKKREVKYYYDGRFIYLGFNLDLIKFCKEVSPKRRMYWYLDKDMCDKKNLLFVLHGYIKVGNQKISGFYIKHIDGYYCFIPYKDEVKKFLEIFGKEDDKVYKEIESFEVNERIREICYFLYVVITDTYNLIAPSNFYVISCDEIVVAKRKGTKLIMFHLENPRINLSFSKFKQLLQTVEKEIRKSQGHTSKLFKLNDNEIKSVYYVICYKLTKNAIFHLKKRLSELFDDEYKRYLIDKKDTKVVNLAKAYLNSIHLRTDSDILYYYADGKTSILDCYKDKIRKMFWDILNRCEDEKYVVWNVKRDDFKNLLNSLK